MALRGGTISNNRQATTMPQGECMNTPHIEPPTFRHIQYHEYDGHHQSVSHDIIMSQSHTETDSYPSRSHSTIKLYSNEPKHRMPE